MIFDGYIGKLDDLLINLVASLITFFVGVLVPLLFNLIYKKTIKKSTGLSLGSRKDSLDIVAYYANSGKFDPVEKTFLGFPFEYMSLAMVEAYLNNLNKNVTVTSSASPLNKDELDSINKNSNLLLIGGPFHNIVVGMLFGLSEEYHNIPLRFVKRGDEDACLLYKNESKEEIFTPKKNEDGSHYAKDFGLIINMKNPYNPKKRVIALIGCRTVGVYCAAKFFSEQNRKTDKLKKHVKGMKEYAVVVSCNCDKNGMVGSPVFEQAWELDSLDIHKISKEPIKNLEKSNI